MSRNMIKANEYIFGKLTNFIQESNTDFAISSRKHCVKTDENEKVWLQELKILDQQQILPNFKTVSFQFNDDNFLVVIGLKRHIENDECIQIVELNAGIVTALLFELDIPVSSQASAFEIIDEIFYESEDGLIKHNFELVASFFNPMIVYKVEVDSPFIVESKIDITRLSGYYIVKDNQSISLDFSRQTLRNFEKLFTEGSKNIPYENILFSLVSVYWKYSFLDIYRCIERLFCVAALDQLHQSLSIPSSLLQFSIDIENHIGWRPKEIVALNKLVSSCPEEALVNLHEIKSKVDGSVGKEYGDIFYDIRNSIVHFRPAIKQLNLTDVDWDKLINSSLLLTIHLYQEYDKKLNLE